MAGLFALPIAYWRYKVQQKQEAEARLIASQYEADMARYQKAQKSKQTPISRHDSLFDDSDDEKPSMEVEHVEDVVLEQDEASEKRRFTSLRYNTLAERTSYSRKRLCALQLC